MYAIAVTWKDDSKPTHYNLPTGTTEGAAADVWEGLVETASKGGKASTVGLLEESNGPARVVRLQEF